MFLSHLYCASSTYQPLCSTLIAHCLVPETLDDILLDHDLAQSYDIVV
jgi:hypothetical protein